MTINSIVITLLVTGLIMFIVGSIWGYFTCNKPNKKILDHFIATLVFGGFGIIVAAGIIAVAFNTINFKGDYKHVDTMKIIALQDDTTPYVKGGRMAFRSEDYVRVCYKRPDGNTQILKFPTDKVVFEDTKEDFRVERYTYTYNSDFVDRSKSMYEKDSRYKIYIPENSIKEDFSVDLK